MNKVNIETKTPIRVAILGGGVAGITIASELSKYSMFDIDIIEKSSVLGGLHRSVDIGNLNYDIGAFLFTRDYGLFDFYPDIIDLYVPVNCKQVNSRLTPKGNIDKYPISIEGYIEDYGLLNFFSTCVEIIASKILYYKKDTLSSWIKYYVGNNLYNKSGLKNYIERLYGVSDENIDLQFATKRMSTIQQVCSLKSILSKIIKLKKPGYLLKNDNLNAFSNSVYQPLARPKEGFGKIYNEIIRDTLISSGVSVLTDCQVKAIRPLDKGFEIKFPDNSIKIYDKLISTIPLETIALLLGKQLDFPIEYRALFSLFYCFNGQLGYDAPILSNFTEEAAWKRIITFSKYYGTYEGGDYFCVEVPVENSNTIDKIQLREDFESHVKHFGLFQGELKYQGDIIIQNAYPVYSRAIVDKIASAKHSFKELGIDVVGRQGEFDYISAGESIANAKKLAEKIKANYGI
ncbi:MULTISPECIES: NAD(P)-binding protein [unclassified Microcystis]|jgi:protoporphyrinogen oxidase|uniref:NAD(P)-binding protein n=1 Tax=unclassified Microcystis TaxID=2643300 RepID=UPI0022BEB1F6|nr:MULTISPECIES: NAD(P)-binding protein [unclassified Microcystis]MCA2694645.1 NAD(P)-binding protein [Microcystis sp. M034S2]MCA2752241.1 NAD(P)-binding protein [Microcystis sp. M144S2]MCZ8202247.1 NAD(P)-binding protein [Microcystis sp. LE19-55.1A]MCZ8305289.1 NAD(P)-binding protein [Microcystis sp. LE19-98.1E]